MTGKALDNIKPIPGESFDAFRNRVHAAMFADIFSTVDRQNEASVRRYIDKGDLRYAVKLMKEWFERKPEDVEVLRRLKAYLIEKRVEVRAVKAGYARTYRKNKRAKRAASDIRVCVVCEKSLAGKRAGALTCSTKCRVKMFRSGPALS
jgi:hypothetical protein